MTHPIAVLAGTPVDTQMGVDFLTGAGLSGTAFPLSADPRQQTAFQISSAAEKQARALAVLRQATEQGCEKAFVYCNSLSASVDFPALSRETGMKIVTPLDVYRSLAPRYRRLAFIAANAQGLAGIERVLLAANPALDTLSAAALTVVLAIGYGAVQGTAHRSKAATDVSNAGSGTPEWFRSGVACALLAPTAMNQQKFTLTWTQEGVRAQAGMGFYTKLDLGIVKYHFELGAGGAPFRWL